MLRLVVIALLSTAPAVVWAQSAGQSADPAVATATSAEQTVGQLAAKLTQLGNHYREQTDASDRLKQEKASWRRDRELRASLADANDTAGQLAQVAAQLKTAQAKLAAARTTAIAAIDLEVAAGDVAAPRAQKLAQLRTRFARPPAAKKLVIPDAEIDPLADPDELDHQATAVRAAEAELARQVAGLDAQAKELQQVAQLRKEHNRAGDLMLREDDQPQRIQGRVSGGGDAAPSAGLSNGAGGGAGGGSAGGGAGGTQTPGSNPTISSDRGPAQSLSFESEATVVLGDVIDKPAIDGMLRASQSGDPAQRAEAAKRAADAVRARLDGLKKQRAAIEARAKTLRKAP